MKFESLLYQVGDLPIFSSSLLQAGDVDRATIYKQLSRWTKGNKIHQLRRGLYAFAEPYRQKDPHPFLIANQLIAPSYVSLQSALAYYDLIPESVPQVLSITSKLRSKELKTPLGTYRFHNIKQKLFMGFQLVQISDDQSAYLARPEKALLDLIYLTKQGHTRAYLESLRLQNHEQIDLDWIRQTANHSKSEKLVEAVDNLSAIFENIQLKEL